MVDDVQRSINHLLAATPLRQVRGILAQPTKLLIQPFLSNSVTRFALGIVQMMQRHFGPLQLRPQIHEASFLPQ